MIFSTSFSDYLYFDIIDYKTMFRFFLVSLSLPGIFQLFLAYIIYFYENALQIVVMCIDNRKIKI